MGYEAIWKLARAFHLPSSRQLDDERVRAQTAVVEAREDMSEVERAWVTKLGIPPGAIERHFGKGK